MKKTFLVSILSIGFMLTMLSGHKAIAAIWACTNGDDPCRNIEAADEAEATAACDTATSTSHLVVAGTCPPPSTSTPSILIPTAAPTQPQIAPDGCEIIDGQEICKLENPIGIGPQGTTEIAEIISIIIKAALGIIGALTLLMFVWGGFQWLTSAGNPERVTSGTQTMVWAVIGVVLVLASYLLLSTFLGFLTGG